MATWRSLETYAPFARELVTFMWEARPPLNPNQFADRVGIRRQLLSNWLNSAPDARIAPEPAVLVRLARVMGRPVSEIFMLAGHTTPDDPLLDLSEAWTYVSRELEREFDLAPMKEMTDTRAPEIFALRDSSEMRGMVAVLLRYLHARGEDASAAHKRPAVRAAVDETSPHEAPLSVAHVDEQITEQAEEPPISHFAEDNSGGAY